MDLGNKNKGILKSWGLKRSEEGGANKGILNWGAKSNREKKSWLLGSKIE